MCTLQAISRTYDSPPDNRSFVRIHYSECLKKFLQFKNKTMKRWVKYFNIFFSKDDIQISEKLCSSIGKRWVETTVQYLMPTRTGGVRTWLCTGVQTDQNPVRWLECKNMSFLWWFGLSTFDWTIHRKAGIGYSHKNIWMFVTAVFMITYKVTQMFTWELDKRCILIAE